MELLHRGNWDGEPEQEILPLSLEDYLLFLQGIVFPLLSYMDQVIDLLPLVIIRWEEKRGRVPKDMGRERTVKEERRNPSPLASGQWTLHLQRTGRRA